MEYRLEILTTMNNKLSKLEMSSTPTSDFRWESAPNFDNNTLSVDLNVQGDNLTEINNNVELLQSIINRAAYEYGTTGSSTVELRLKILDTNGAVDQIGHLEVVAGEISGVKIDDVELINKQKQIHLELYTVGEFRRYNSKIYNLPEGSTSVVNSINGRVGYKWINNILTNSHFEDGLFQGNTFFANDETINWPTYWNLYGTSASLTNVIQNKTERAMIPPYCVQIDANGLTAGNTRGFHQICSGVVAPYALGAMWYTWDDGADGNLVLELNHGATTERTIVDVGSEVINSHPLSNGYKVSTVLFNDVTVSGVLNYRVYMSGVSNGNIYVGGTLINAFATDTQNNTFFDLPHPQDTVASGIYNTTTEDYDSWIPYVSSTYIKNRMDGMKYASTANNIVTDKNNIVVWGMPGETNADTALAVYYNEDIIETADTEEIFIGKQTHRDYYDYRNVPFFRNSSGASAGTNWTNSLTTGNTDIRLHNQSFARLDADGLTDGLYRFTYNYLSDIPLNLFKTMTFRAIGRFSVSTAANVNSIRLGYSTAREGSGTPVNIIYNPPADLGYLIDGEIQSTNGGGTGTNVPQFWTLLDLGTVKFDAGNISEYRDSNGDYVGQSITIYIDVDADNGTRVYLDDVFIIPSEEFFYSDRGHDNVDGDWNISFSREMQYSRFDSGTNIRRMSLVSQDYSGVPITITPWLPNRIFYLQQRNTTQAANIQQYFEDNYSVDIMLADNVTNRTRLAQSFVTVSARVNLQASAYLLKTGSPTGTITASIQADSGGAPSGTMLASITLPESRLETTYRWIRFDFGNVTLAATTTYWFVIETDRSPSGTNYVRWGADNTAPTGGGSMSAYAGSWAAIATTDAISIFSDIKGFHTLEDNMRLWVGYNPKSKFLLPRNPDPNPA